MTAQLTGLAAAEEQERADEVREREAWLSIVGAAREALPMDDAKAPLDSYLRVVMTTAKVDSLTAKRALSFLRAQHEALYKFGEGVYRPTASH